MKPLVVGFCDSLFLYETTNFFNFPLWIDCLRSAQSQGLIQPISILIFQMYNQSVDENLILLVSYKGCTTQDCKFFPFVRYPMFDIGFVVTLCNLCCVDHFWSQYLATNQECCFQKRVNIRTSSFTSQELCWNVGKVS